MATRIVQGDIVVFQAQMAAAFNQLARLSVGSSVHYDAGTTEYALTYATLSGTGAGPTAAAVAAANQLMVKYKQHLADAVAHKVADAPPALTAATDLATAITLANAVKSDYATHRASTTYHAAADSTNTISASDATDLASLQTLLNEFVASGFNQHIADAPAVASLRVVPV